MRLKVDSQEKDRLDGFVINVEFLLISVIQGAALATLGATAAPIVSGYNLEYFPYIASALIFILTFWAQAIVHTLSFIEWPIDMVHNFLYFMVGLVEVVAFTNLTNPQKWFESIFFFFVIAGILYMYDLYLLKKEKSSFDDSSARKKLYSHTLHRQRFELFVFLPAAIVYNVVAWYLLKQYPEVFIKQNYQIVLISIQLLFGVVFLLDSLKSFKTRIRLITQSV